MRMPAFDAVLLLSFGGPERSEDVMPFLRRVTAGCFLDNERSWRLMERLGMRREGTYLADSLHRSGRWLDSCSYALLREEWRNRAAASAQASAS